MTPYDAFIPAKWFHSGRRKPVRLLVAHCTVSTESGTGAEAVAKYFGRGERRASAHAVGDNNSVVGCVSDGDTAFAAAGANSDGWHFEFVGQPNQTAAQWDDDFSRDMLRRAAPYWRERAQAWGIPIRWLTVDQVRDGEAGLCTHDDISKAFPEVSTGHWDPGPHFPKADFLLLVKGHLPEEDDTMPPAPAVVFNAAGVRHVFARGQHPDNNLWWKYADQGFTKAVCNGGNPAVADNNTPGCLAPGSDVKASLNAKDGTITVTGIGPDGQLFATVWNGAVFTPWAPLGGRS